MELQSRFIGVALEMRMLFALMVAGGLFLIWGKKGEEQQEETAKKEFGHTLAVAPGPSTWATVLPRIATQKSKGVPLVLPQGRVHRSLLALSHIYTAGSEGGSKPPSLTNPS